MQLNPQHAEHRNRITAKGNVRQKEHIRHAVLTVLPVCWRCSLNKTHTNDKLTVTPMASCSSH